MEQAGSIVALDTYDVRFPTSRELDGSDAMHPDPDYSAAYVVVRTNAAVWTWLPRPMVNAKPWPWWPSAAIRSLAPLVVGRGLEATMSGLGDL